MMQYESTTAAENGVVLYMYLNERAKKARSFRVYHQTAALQQRKRRVPAHGEIGGSSGVNGRFHGIRHVLHDE